MSPSPSDHPVRIARIEKGWRLVDLALKAECSAPLLSNVEHGYVPKLPTMERIAKALDTDPARLWPDEFDERPVPPDPDAPPWEATDE